MGFEDARKRAGAPGTPADSPGGGLPVEPVTAGGLSVVPALFGSPSDAFRRLAADPKWIGTAGLLLVIMVLAIWVQLPQQLAMMEENMLASMEKFGLADEAIDEALAGLPDAENLAPGDIAQQLASGIFPVLFAVFLGGTLFHWIAKIAGATPRWKQSVSIFTLVYVVSALGALAKAGVARASDTMEVTLGPGILFPGLDHYSIPALLLDMFDVFSLLALFLLALGARVAFRVTPGASWGIAGTYWLLKSLFIFAFTAGTAWMMGAL